MHQKLNLAKTLPRNRSDLTLRVWIRSDVDILARWPSYPFPFQPFNLSCTGRPSAALDSYFAVRDSDSRRLTVVLDSPSQMVIAYLALLEIDYATGVVGNLAVRLHPAYCDHGVGTAMLTLLCGWAEEAELTSLRLDVAAANQRAVRCYGKAGFALLSEFWRDEGNLTLRDLARPEYAFARPHVRECNSALQSRFYQMEFTTSHHRHCGVLGV